MAPANFSGLDQIFVVEILQKIKCLQDIIFQLIKTLALEYLIVRK